MKRKIFNILALILALGLCLAIAAQTAIPVLAAPPHMYESYDTGDDSSNNVYGINWYGQTFTPSVAHTIKSVKLKLYRVGSPGNVTVSIRATNVNGHPILPDLCSGTIDGNTLNSTSPGSWYEITLGSGYNLSASTKYAIVVRAPSGTYYLPANYLVWRRDETTPAYSGGCREDSGTSGADGTWTNNTARDMMFEEWGNRAPVATAQNLSVNSCSTLTVTLNGTDADGDTLTAYKISALPLPSHGNLYDGTGTNGTHITSVPYTVTDVTHKVTYQPVSNYSGADSFGFKVNDGADDSAQASISITVSDTRSTWYQDNDVDSYGNPAVSQKACSQPSGYVLNNTDCNDNNANEHPGQTWYKDADSDLYSDGTTNTTSCTRPTGYKVASELTATSGDCNDTNAAVNPGATEVCNGIDDNCNGSIDEGVKTTWYQDNDGDGYGNPAVSQQACSQPSGYVLNNTDCNDSNANEHPGQTWYKDADSDLYSDGTTNTTSCTRPTGYKVASELTAISGDCNDTNAAVNPAATEVCNGIDDNCNGSIDEGVKTTYYQDADSDTYGNPAVSQQACSQPSGYVLDNTDCNDSNANEHPGQTWYKDTDNDGYSDGTTNTTSCTRPTGYKIASELIATSGDCNDNNPAINDCDLLDGWVADGGNYTACNGTQVCTYQDMVYLDYECVGGECVSTETDSRTDLIGCQSCDDSDPCTIDTCENGVCVHTPIDCDYLDGWVADGSNYTACNGTQVCTYQDMVYLDYGCVEGECVSTPTDWRTDLIGCQSCDDGNPCTIDTCENGQCVHTPIYADILAYYRGLYGDPDVVDTSELLAAAYDWIYDVVPACFQEPITTLQLLQLANEWIAAGP